ncbi:MAG: hypothetical protein A3F11_09395 [Gammaproteobacteria bacterium RIFCSPHIGHO2_12_FULL_37_14]|nr:MAG: hypothetical protein A3F11_09395 [Gammaproteobacteria bacterium RIFCSPHIGHO2_12_FULL_37_14]
MLNKTQLEKEFLEFLNKILNNKDLIELAVYDRQTIFFHVDMNDGGVLPTPRETYSLSTAEIFDAFNPDGSINSKQCTKYNITMDIGRANATRETFGLDAQALISPRELIILDSAIWVAQNYVILKHADDARKIQDIEDTEEKIQAIDLIYKSGQRVSPRLRDIHLSSPNYAPSLAFQKNLNELINELNTTQLNTTLSLPSLKSDAENTQNEYEKAELARDKEELEIIIPEKNKALVKQKTIKARKDLEEIIKTSEIQTHPDLLKLATASQATLVKAEEVVDKVPRKDMSLFMRTITQIIDLVKEASNTNFNALGKTVEATMNTEWGKNFPYGQIMDCLPSLPNIRDDQFHLACAELEQAITNASDDKNPLKAALATVSGSALKTARQAVIDNKVPTDDMPLLTRALKDNAALVKNPSEKTYQALKKTAKEIYGINREWGKMMGGALGVVLGSTLILASLATAVVTVGTGTPISLLLGALGVSLIGSTALGASVTVGAGLFTHRKRKGNITLSEENVLETYQSKKAKT